MPSHTLKFQDQLETVEVVLREAPLLPEGTAQKTNERIAVIGLGYVGLPLAVELAKAYKDVIGFDVASRRVAELQNHIDQTGEASVQELCNSSMRVSDQLDQLTDTNFFIVTVPTPIDESNRPDLSLIKNACEMIGTLLSVGDIVVFESTVYPGVTRKICTPILEAASGLKAGSDFHVGYSPERINPGDKHKSLKNITKVVSADSPEALERVAEVYESIIIAGVHRCETIEIAEAAKVIENTQRDVNIALMNEIALIFDRVGIDTGQVLEAAATKWNFMQFRPGLVGGHCIGVDPYYLSSLSEMVGHNPRIILAARRVNESIAPYVASQVIKNLCQQGADIKTARIGVFGLTFKENCPDLRNSKSFDIIHEMQTYGAQVAVHDPFVEVGEEVEPGLVASSMDDMNDIDAMVLAVAHQNYINDPEFLDRLSSRGALIDVKRTFDNSVVTSGQTYWAL